jgi:hypothetical protein
MIDQCGPHAWEIPLYELWLFPCAHDLLVDALNEFLAKEF